VRRFYTHQHKHYCGIDLQARTMYVCLLDPAGTLLVHSHVSATPEAFLRIVAPDPHRSRTGGLGLRFT
jgi:hypothetical protein